MRNLFVLCAAAGLVSSVSGQVIMSPDGMWAGTLDANGTGQLISIALNGDDDIFETLFYESSTGSGSTSWLVEANYNAVSQNVGANSASYELLRFDGKVSLSVNVEMIDGVSGGAIFTMTYTNVGTTVEELQPFFYGDIDAEPGFGGDSSNWLAAANAVEQFDTAALWWLGALETYTGWEIDTFPILRNNLTFGVPSLLNTGGGGAADWTAAVSGEIAMLAPGQSVTMTVGLGGEGISAGGCPCACDMDTSTGLGVCDLFDFLAFQGGFVAGETCQCDIDTTTGVGVCDLFDFLAFQGAFVAGCP